MKDNKHIQSFGEFNENLNSELSEDTSSSISDVSDSGLFESKLGDFVSDGKFMIIDIIDPQDDVINIEHDLYDEKYVEFTAYGVDDKKFYLLDPDYDVIEGPYDTIKELYNEIGIEEIPDFK